MIEYASHGYLCMSMNDKTGNCSWYTETPDGKSIPITITAFNGAEEKLI